MPHNNFTDNEYIGKMRQHTLTHTHTHTHILTTYAKCSQNVKAAEKHIAVEIGEKGVKDVQCWAKIIKLIINKS